MGNYCKSPEKSPEKVEHWSQRPICAQRVLQFFLILQNPPPPKVTQSTFYNISSSLLMLSASKFFWWDKSIFALRNQFFFDGKPKMTKKSEFEELKIPNPDIWPFWEIFNFSKSTFFCHFWFPIKKVFFSFFEAQLWILYDHRKHAVEICFFDCPPWRQKF